MTAQGKGVREIGVALRRTAARAIAWPFELDELEVAGSAQDRHERRDDLGRVRRLRHPIGQPRAGESELGLQRDGAQIALGVVWAAQPDVSVLISCSYARSDARLDCGLSGRTETTTETAALDGREDGRVLVGEGEDLALDLGPVNDAANRSQAPRRVKARAARPEKPAR